MRDASINIIIGDKLIDLKRIYEMSEKYSVGIHTESDFTDEIKFIELLHTQMTEILDNIYKGDMLSKYNCGDMSSHEYFSKVHSRELKDNPYFHFGEE